MNRNAIASLGMLSAAAMTASAPASAQTTMQEYNIGPQSLSSALQEFSRVSDIQVLFPSDAIADRRTDGIHGRMTAREAVQRLIDGSRLRIASIDDNTIALTAITTDTTRAPQVASTDAGRDIIVTARVAREKAIAMKREATNIREVATADSAGKLPDKNLADALSRLTGVSLERDKGEGRFVSIRGISPELNNVTLGGQPTALPDVDGRAGRAAPLDVIGSGDFQAVEVIKTLRPDMDAQGIGGTINILPPSGFDRTKAFGYASAEYGVNDLESAADIYSGSAGYGTQFGDGGMALFLGGEYSKREYRTENVAGSRWSEEGGYYVPDRLRLQNFSSSRERYGLTGNLDMRNDDGNSGYFRVVYNHFTQEDYRPELQFDKDGNILNQTPTTGTFTEGDVNLESLRKEAERSILNMSIGSKLSFGDGSLIVEPQFTYSKAHENVPVYDAYEFNVDENQPIDYDLSDQLFTFDTGQMRFDPANFVLDEFRIDTSKEKEQLLVPSLDVTWKPELLGTGTYFKIGGKATLRHRFVNDNSNRYNSVDPLYLDGFSISGPDDFRGKYNIGPLPDQDALRAYFDAHPEAFALNEARSISNSFEDDYDITEKIFAGYALANLDLGALTLLGGVRVEHTDTTIGATQVLELDGDFAGTEPMTGKHNYTDVFPNVQARYDITDTLLVRAAYTTAMGRPDYVALAPISTLEADETTPGSNLYDGELEIGNPELKPYKAQNLDLTLEFYPNKGGLLSVGAFYKHVDNPIFERSLFFTDVTRDGRDFRELSVDTTENAESGEIYGLEVNVQQQLAFLPGLLSGFGVSANASFIKSSVTVFGRDDDLSFFTQPDRVYNAQLFYEKGIIAARVAYQYRSEFLESLGGEAMEDIYQDSNGQLDAKLSVKLLKNVVAYAEGQNLTDEPFRRYQGVPSHLAGEGESGNEIFGRTFRFGLSAQF
ncbi:TonB-dependent receptor [Stakelama saccharophila]|uniref:TonB-dependent receptor n=1 Tax=Stakelama saccharophila TaxID=3075605 RepID=A0ABZ0B512_9SPHN|nr:TonB-dependent receptor [Stakelama sp. W311]WNO52414.1 TonB-dependent receptor [Stakelama sp. W311]